MTYIVPQMATDIKIWTPGVSFGGGTTGITYSSQGGQWFRYGSIIFVNGYFTLNNKGTSPGSALLTGLPVPSNASLNSLMVTTPFYSIITLLGAAYVPLAYLQPNVTTLDLRQTNGSGSAALTDTAFANNSQVNVTFFYFS